MRSILVRRVQARLASASIVEEYFRGETGFPDKIDWDALRPYAKAIDTSHLPCERGWFGMARKQPRYTGRTTGMGVTEYQDHTFRINDQRKLTDARLSDDWSKEFPEAKRISPSEIAGIRRRYNIGSQGHGPAETWSFPYTDEGLQYQYSNGSSIIPANWRGNRPAVVPSAAISSTRNPAWQRDELILALDLYFRVGHRVADDSDPAVVELSELLNELPIHPSRPDAARFRNPNGVALKLANFRAIEQPGRGMSRGNQLEVVVWNEFATDPARLRAIAVAIESGARSVDARPDVVVAEADDEEEFAEGRIVYRQHRSRERNRELVRQKKAQILNATGRLACEACDFDFSRAYGELGDGFIECHHTRPLSELAVPRATKLRGCIKTPTGDTSGALRAANK